MNKLALFAALSLFAAPIGAQAQSAPDAAQQFAQKVAISDMFEIESSKLVADKTKDDGIKKFANHMMTDHQKTTNELKELVEKGKLKATLPNGLDAEHQEKMKQLQSASGDQLDRAYSTIQVKAHEDAVALFENYSKSGDNADLKNWAAKTLPNLKEHLSEAKKLKGAGGTTGSSQH